MGTSIGTKKVKTVNKANERISRDKKEEESMIFRPQEDNK